MKSTLHLGLRQIRALNAAPQSLARTHHATFPGSSRVSDEGSGLGMSSGHSWPGGQWLENHWRIRL